MAFGPANETLVVNIVLRSDADVAIKKVNNQIRRFSDQTRANLSGAQRAFRAFGATARGVGRTLRGLTAPLRSLSRRWGALGATIATTLATFKAVSDAQKFGIAVAEISTIFDDTELPLAQVEERLLGLSEALGLVETIAAKGFYQIISSDITDAAEAMIVLEESAELATAGLADIKGTIDVVTSVIKAYQKDVSETAEITDILFRTVEKGKTTIPELSTSLGQVLPIAASLGVSFREVTAAVATLTQGGIETNTAVIQLRQAFNQLLKPSVEAGEVLAQYQIDISQSAIKSKQFSGVLAELREKLGNNAVAYARIFGNIRGLLPVLALADKQFEQHQKNLKALENSYGAVGGALDRLFASPFKRVQVFINAIRIRLRGVGEVFIKALDEALGGEKGIRKAIEALDTAFNMMKGVASEAAKFVGDFVEQLENLIQRLDAIGGAGAAFRQMGEVIGAAVTLVARAVAAIGIAITELLAQLPKVMAALVRELQKSINALDPMPWRRIFDVELTKEELRADIADVQRAYADEVRRARERLQEAGLHFEILTDDQTGQARPAQEVIDQIRRLEEMTASGVTIPFNEEILFGPIRRMEEMREGMAALRAELETAPDSVNDIALSLDSAVEPLSLVTDGVNNLREAWRGLDAALGRDAIAAIAAEMFPDALRVPLEVDFADPFGFESGGDTLDLLIARRLAEERAQIDEEAARIGDELKALERLFGDLQIEVPVDIAVFFDDSSDATQEVLDELRGMLEAEFPVSVPITMGEENLLSFIDRAQEAVNILNSLREPVADSLQDELDILDAGVGLRRAQLAVQLRQIGANKELTAEALRAFEAAEKAQRAAIIGFSDGLQFFEQLAGKAEVTYELQAEGIERATEKLREQLDLAIELGFVAVELRPRFEAAIDANRAKQFADALDFESIRKEVEVFAKTTTISMQDQVTLAQSVAKEERERLVRLAENVSLTEEQRDLLLHMAEAVESVKIREALDFSSVSDELDNIRANVQPLFVDIVRREEERFAVIEERNRLLVETGQRTQSELTQIREAIELERERLTIEQARSVLSSAAFEQRSFVSGARETIDFEARTDALDNLGLTEIPEIGTKAFDDLRREYNRVLEEMLGDSEAFRDGFLSTLGDLALEFGDSFETGAALARDAIYSVRNATANALAELMTLHEEGENTAEAVVEAFRQNLARGLAQAVSNALTDMTLGFLLSPFEGLAEKLGFGEDPESLAVAEFAGQELAKIQAAATQSIAEVSQAGTAAATSIEGTFAAQLPQLQAVLEMPAVKLNLAADKLLALAAGQMATGAALAPGAVAGAAQGAAAGGGYGAAVGAMSGMAVEGGKLAAEALTQSAEDLALAAATSEAAGQAVSVAGSASLHPAGSALIAAAAALDAAAAVLAASGTVGGATGGVFPSLGNIESPTLKFGDGGIKRPIQKLGLGGIKMTRTFAEIGERGQPEAVVPLPGAGRAIPVEFQNPERAYAGGSAPVNMTVAVNTTLSFQNLDPRSTQEVVAAQLPGINRMIAASLTTGRDRNLEKAIQQVARRGQ